MPTPVPVMGRIKVAKVAEMGKGGDVFPVDKVCADEDSGRNAMATHCLGPQHINLGGCGLGVVGESSG